MGAGGPGEGCLVQVPDMGTPCGHMVVGPCAISTLRASQSVQSSDAGVFGCVQLAFAHSPVRKVAPDHFHNQEYKAKYQRRKQLELHLQPERTLVRPWPLGLFMSIAVCLPIAEKRPWAACHRSGNTNPQDGILRRHKI